jgi:hypothetical protein
MSYASINEAFGISSFREPNQPQRQKRQQRQRQNGQQRQQRQQPQQPQQRKQRQNNTKSNNYKLIESFNNYNESDESDSDIDDVIESFEKEYENKSPTSSTEKQLVKMQESITSILKRLDSNNTQNILFNKNMHDIILFIIFGLFVVLLLEALFKLANNRKL